jgi:integrase/recombinase XerD
VAAYIKLLHGRRSDPTVKQHLACIRMLFDWLVIGQVMPANSAHSVQCPRHSVTKGSTPVLSSEEATAILTGSCHLAGCPATLPVRRRLRRR